MVEFCLNADKKHPIILFFLVWHSFYIFYTSLLQVDYDEAMFLWRVAKRDFFLWIITFIFTLFLGIEIGVLIGVSIDWYYNVLVNNMNGNVSFFMLL